MNGLRIRSPSRTPESGQDGEPLCVKKFVALDVCPRGKSHVADMPGYHHGDFAGAHVGGGTYRGGDPSVCQVVPVRELAVLYQQHDGVCVDALFGADEPGIVGNSADARLGGIHEVRQSLDVGGPPLEIVGNRCLPGSSLLGHEPGKD